MTWSGDSPAAVRPDTGEFRTAMGRFATGVTLVTAAADGEEQAMTANAFTSVSLDPLLVMVSVRTTARFHHTLLRAGQWGVSVLPDDAVHLARWFAHSGRPPTRQLDPRLFVRGPVTGVALLSTALGALECQTYAFYPGGDHTLVLGEVVAVHTNPGPGRPLVYYEADYHSLSG